VQELIKMNIIQLHLYIMSTYLPPTHILTIYNEAEFPSLNDPLTTTSANSKYLKLTGGTETGLVNFNAGLSSKAGAANAPSIYLDGDTTSGIYRSGANEIAISTSGTQRAKISSAGLSLTTGSSSNPSLYFASDTTNGFYRISNGVGFTSGGGSTLITLNNLGINNSAKTFTEQLVVGSGGNTIKLMQFGSQGFSITFTPGQYQGPYSITFPTNYSSTPRVMTSLVNLGGDPSQHVGYQVIFVGTASFQVAFSNESSLNIGANTYQIDWMAVN